MLQFLHKKHTTITPVPPPFIIANLKVRCDLKEWLKSLADPKFISTIKRLRRESWAIEQLIIRAIADSTVGLYLDISNVLREKISAINEQEYLAVECLIFSYFSLLTRLDTRNQTQRCEDLYDTIHDICLLRTNIDQDEIETMIDARKKMYKNEVLRTSTSSSRYLCRTLIHVINYGTFLPEEDQMAYQTGDLALEILLNQSIIDFISKNFQIILDQSVRFEDEE